jgi:hypothetical protein
MSQETALSREERLSRHALWLYGVIVGLAIKHALESVLIHFYVPPDARRWPILLEATRLFVFLLMIIRFYLGGIVYFEKVYGSPDSANKYPDRTFSLDFMFGTIHYLFFFALAGSINAYEFHPKFFAIILSVILLYDLAWLWSSRHKSTLRRIKLWAFINLVTFVLAAVLYLVMAFFQFNYAVSQQIACLPVILASFVDLAEVLKGRRYFGPWFKKLADESESPDPPQGATN